MIEKWTEAVTFEKLNKNKCCGCEACLNVCPVDAIQMFPDDLGFLYPKTDLSKCIDCKLCIKKCPQIKKPDETIKERVVYAGYATEKEIVEESSSGGLFSVIAEAFLKEYKNSYVVSVVWSDDFKSAYHKMGRLEDLDEMRKSKYIQSRKGFVFRDIKEHLERGDSILFVGCPCEVAGLKEFLGEKDYKNLFTIDLVCQGPTSPKVMEEYVDILEKHYDSKIEKLNLRFNGGKTWIPQWINVKFKNNKDFIRVFYETELGIAVHYMQRNACYSCEWNGKRRKADITLGDYHGADTTAEYYNSRGTSVIVVNTEKGKQLMGLFPGKNAVLTDASYEFIASKNPRIEKAWDPLPGAKKFIELYRKNKLKNTVIKTLPVKKKIKYLLPTKISEMINHRVK